MTDRDAESVPSLPRSPVVLDGVEVRFDDLAGVDEVVAAGTGVPVHVERMGDGCIWMQIGDETFTFYTRRGAAIHICWRDDPGPSRSKEPRS